MEKNPSYAEEINNYYSKNQKYILENIPKVNEFQKIYGFKEFNDITIRCCNSNVNAYKTLKKKGLNPNDTDFIILMNAYTTYVDSKLYEGLDSLNRYMEELLMIFIGKQHTLKQLIKELNPNYIPKELYEKSQYNVENYLNIADEIYNIDLEKDMDKIIELFINKKYEQIIYRPNSDILVNIEYFNSTLTVLAEILRNAFKKLHLESSIYTLNDTITKVLSKEDEIINTDKKKTKKK